MLVGVVVGVFLWRPSSTIDVLPHGELHCGATSRCNRSKHEPKQMGRLGLEDYSASLLQTLLLIDLLLAELRPEVWKTEHLLEEDVVLGSCAWPLVKLVHYLDVACEVANGLDDKETSSDGIHTSLPVLPWRVVRWSFPESLCRRTV